MGASKKGGDVLVLLQVVEVNGVVRKTRKTSRQMCLTDSTILRFKVNI